MTTPEDLRSHGRRKWFVALALIGCCAGAVVGLRALDRHLDPDPFAARPFDPAAWAAADQEGRSAMTRDAVRHLPAGLPESAIEPLLGKPSEIIETDRLTASRPRGSTRTYSYYLGCWSWEYYDSTFLWVHVGPDGRVVATVIGGR